ncbi:FAD-dependent oxidoreductase [Pseudoalteromonas luteoviolacea]|uniref:FAD-dependent oxidoreductase n=1 Tax=Pseudoalteromonas luteoviolacea TaxID=43657 RepID=UPI0011515FAF|nr:FAD-dependent oxidoreductase [Pseudoalteromonas luteoviolacea]TQF71347.1 FAD-dependent oxidoreductase [Pseudoalteromonas luteoviolacea]
MNRRKLLIGAGYGLGMLGLSSCSSIPITNSNKRGRYHHYTPLKSSMQRVTHSVVGLRPFRPDGYRLESQKIANKTLVHNYGHGGGGITLSWGTSIIAAQLASKPLAKDIAIIGSGVMGLTTALILSREGFNVTIYAEDFPPNTTSNIAAALWLPSSYFDRSIVKPEFLEKDRQIIRGSFSRFLSFVNVPRYGVYWNNYHLLLPKVRDSIRALPGGNDLYPNLATSTKDNLFGYPYQSYMKALIIDPMLYLPAILQDAQMAGVKLKQTKFDNKDQVLALTENVIVNCSGLGASKLFGDESMYPIQGQLTHLLPQPEINYSYVVPTPEGYLYMFPRKGSIVIGGTAVKRAYSTQPDQQLTESMVRGHADLARKLTS